MENKILGQSEIKKTRVYLSLGGNEGNVLPCIQQALALLSSQNGIDELENSHFYGTSPLQVNSSLWFINAACSFQTYLSPSEIFKITQSIERQLGKVPKPKTSDRPIDIDFLFYGDQFYQDLELEIPHPSWKERLFVLIPLADLTKEVILQRKEKKESYFLDDLIHPLFDQLSQDFYLLEKNPRLQ